MHPCLHLPIRGRIFVFGVLLAVSIASILPLQTARAATVIYVIPNGAGSGSGTYWANATTLTAALSAAVPGNQIWVRAGTYLPGTERKAAFNLKVALPSMEDLPVMRARSISAIQRSTLPS